MTDRSSCDLTVSELFQAYFDCRKTKRIVQGRLSLRRVLNAT